MVEIVNGVAYVHWGVALLTLTIGAAAGLLVMACLQVGSGRRDSW